MVTLEPLISMTAWLSLAAAAILAFALFFARRPSSTPRRTWRWLSALTGLGMVAVLAVLLNPTRVERVPEAPGKPLLTILVDGTGSMGTPDGKNGETRFQSASRWGRELAAASEGGFDVRVALFDEKTKTVAASDLAGAQPTGAATNLAAALREAIAEQRPQGQAVVLLSDGIHNVGEVGPVLQAARDARALGCPIMTHAFGTDHEAVDLAVEVRTPNEIAFVGQPIRLSALLSHHGLKGESVAVHLSRDGKEIDKRAVKLDSPAGEEVRFETPALPVGLYRFDFEVPPLPREMSRTNNSASVLLNVIDRPVRVLLVEGKPYWDGKFLARTLSDDPSMELDCVIRVGEGRLHHRAIRRVADKANGKATADEKSEVIDDFGKFLAENRGLESYQVIVLGRDAETLLEDGVLRELRAWLTESGGSLVCFRGQPVAQVSQKLAPMLPLRWSPSTETRVRWELTDQGKDLGWLLGSESAVSLPSLATVARAEKPRPLAVVLAVADRGGASSPAVTYQPYGLGRVVVIEGSGMWRWAFPPPGQKTSDRIYGTLWRNLLRWLVSNAPLLPGQDMALRGDSMTYSPEEAVALTLITRRDARIAPPPALELRGGALTEPRTITPVASADDPGVFRVPLGRLPEGRYRIEAPGRPGARTLFDVRSSSRETLDLKARPDLMAAISRESGGIVLKEAAPATIYDRVRKQFQRGRPGHVVRSPLWDRAWVFVLIGGFWAFTWIIRRRHHLL